MEVYFCENPRWLLSVSTKRDDGQNLPHGTTIIGPYIISDAQWTEIFSHPYVSSEEMSDFLKQFIQKNIAVILDWELGMLEQWVA